MDKNPLLLSKINKLNNIIKEKKTSENDYKEQSIRYSKNSLLGKPQLKVVVRGMDMFITADDLEKSMGDIKPVSVEVQPPPYQEIALVIFSSLKDSTAFVEINQRRAGTAVIKDKVLFLDYMQPGEDIDLYVSAGVKTKLVGDWLCGNCKYQNFSRRECCNICKTPRQFAENVNFDDRPVSLARKFSLNSMEKEIFKYGIFAPEVLAVSGFESPPEKDTIRYTFAPLAAVKAVSIRKPVRNDDEKATQTHAGSGPDDGVKTQTVAFVEFYSRSEAEDVIKAHRKSPLAVGGKEVKVVFAEKISREDKKKYEIRLSAADSAKKERRKRKSENYDKALSDYKDAELHEQHRTERSHRSSRSKRSSRSRHKSQERRKRRKSESSPRSKRNRNSSSPERERSKKRSRRSKRRSEEKSAFIRDFEQKGKELKERFVYDPTTGFYCDVESGYLYDPVTQVYCHAQSKSCFLWNEKTLAFDSTQNVGRFGYLVNPVTPAVSTTNPAVTDSAVKIINHPKKIPFKIPEVIPKSKKKKAPAKTVTRNDKTIFASGNSSQKKFSRFGKIAKSASMLKNSEKAEQFGQDIATAQLSTNEISTPTDSRRAESRNPAQRDVHRRTTDAKSVYKSAGRGRLCRIDLMNFLIFYIFWDNLLALVHSASSNAPHFSSSPATDGASAARSAPVMSGVDSMLELGGKKDFFDYERIACLLCKRGFTSLEIMKKHAKQSELHKKNMQIFEIKKAARDKLRAQSTNKLFVTESKTQYETKKDDEYRGHVKNMLRQRFQATQRAEIKSNLSLDQIKNSEYLNQMKKFSSENCSDNFETRNAIVK